jgi:hypothetical protein
LPVIGVADLELPLEVTQAELSLSSPEDPELEGSLPEQFDDTEDL